MATYKTIEAMEHQVEKTWKIEIELGLFSGLSRE